MYHYGGIYLDVDFECLKPFRNFTLLHDCFLSQEPIEHPHFLNQMDEPLVSNALMGCRPQHPFFKFVIDHLNDFTGWISWHDILHATGPFMLTRMYKSYHYGLHFNLQRDHIALIEDKVFQPTIDDSMLRHIIEKCHHSIEKQFASLAYRTSHLSLCAKLLSISFSNTPKSESLTNHHWTHLWAGKRYDPWGVFNTEIGFDISELGFSRNVSTVISHQIRSKRKFP